MTCKSNFFKMLSVFFFLTAWGFLLTGCPGKSAKGGKLGDQSSDTIRRITDISVDAGRDSAEVYVQGNIELTYSPEKQTEPPALILNFSDTVLDTPKTQLTPESGIIRAISASESEDGRQSKIEIYLSEDIPYEITKDGLELKISFRKGAKKSAQTATRLQSVYATSIKDGLKVFVEADGRITNYKSFTSENPPRIIFDIFNVASPYKAEKKVSVDSKWVKQVRYFDFEDRLRVVLDTDKSNLSEFSATPVDNGLVIYLGKSAKSMDSSRQALSPDEKKNMAAPTRLQSVYATQIENGTMVTIRADSAITDYQSSVIEDPPTIVFDIPHVSNPYEKEESFPVETQWIKRIRHVSEPDRLRVLIETQPQYLSKYTAYAYKNGLIIRVQGTGAPVTTARTESYREPSYLPTEDIASKRTKGTIAPKTKAETRKRGGTAWVNRIEFVDEPAGRTTLVIATTQPVEYNVQDISDHRVQLKLFNTKIPPHHQRPLITTRFDSSVDRITPVSKRGDTSIFDIEMREKAPYNVEQIGDELLVHFEASSVPPKGGELPPPPPAPTIAATEPPPSAPTAMSMETPKVAAPSVPAAPPVPAVPTTPAGASPTVMAPSMPLAMAPLPAVPSPGLPEDLSQKYTGEKIALDFFETDIKNVFRILREVSGKNFAIDNDVTGKVTLTLEHPVPWDQVLDLILKMNKLGKVYEGDIIRISTLKTLLEEEKDREEKLKAQASIQEQKKALEPVETEYIPVNYSKAKTEILPHIQQIITKEPKDRASVSVDERTNMIIITDTAEKRKQARQIVEKLDRVTPQVIIEAKVVEATANFSKEIGTQWGAGAGVQSTNLLTNVGGISDTVADNVNDRVGVGPERGYNALGGTYGYNMAVNLPTVSSAVGSIGFNFMRIAGTPLLLDAKLMAMESKGEGKIISSPKIVTLDNKQATIKQGVSYPYNKLDDKGNTTTEFKEIDLVLDVTPHVTPDNRISMIISIAKRDLGELIGNQRAFTNKEAKTELLVNDGDTVVIGGIMKSTESTSDRGLPGLSKIPILGWLFKAKDSSERNEELLIFITPRIVQLEQRVSVF